MKKSIAGFIKSISTNLNFSLSIRFNNKKFIIPIIKNLGFMNMQLGNQWLPGFINSLNLQKDASIVDIGANVGQTLIAIRSSCNNPYWGFEPNSACVFYLHNLIRLNKFKDAHILPVGLADEPQVAKFFLKGDVDQAGTLMSELRPGLYNAEDVTFVPIFAFDKLEVARVPSISLIKIDVEGAEFLVLKGMTETIKKHQPYIICEVLDYASEENKIAMQERATNITKHMKDLNYNIYQLKHTGHKLTAEKIDNIVLKLWVESSFEVNDYLFVPANKPLPAF